MVSMVSFCFFFDELLESVSEIFVKITTYLNFVILENELLSDSKVSQPKKNLLFLFSYEKKLITLKKT